MATDITRAAQHDQRGSLLDVLGRRRRILQIVLGLIWLVDAGMQFKPFMFRESFVKTYLVGNQAGNPQFVKTPMGWVAHLVAHSPAGFNIVFALIQVGLAIGIFWRPTVKPALGASIVWAFGVWWFGEGMGGVFSGLTPAMGEPGAVLIYALIAVLVWPSRRTSDSVATSGPLSDGTARMLWLILWLSFVRFLLLSANRAPEGLNQMFSAMNPGEPEWAKSINNNLASAFEHHGTQASIVLAVVCGLVAVAIFVPALLKPALILAGIAALFFWVAQDFGGTFTSSGTDPNSGPLLVLLAATFWPVGARTAARAHTG